MFKVTHYVEELIRDPSFVFESPVSADVGTWPSSSSAEVLTGRQMRKRAFMLDERWTFVNHGAFGAAACVPYETACKWRSFAEAQPLRHVLTRNAYGKSGLLEPVCRFAVDLH